MKDIVGFCKTTKTEVTEQIKTKEALIQKNQAKRNTTTYQTPSKKTKNYGLDS